MTRQQICAAIADRFARWAKRLVDQGATPIMTVGVTMLDGKDHTIVLCTCEETDDARVLEILTAAQRLWAVRVTDRATLRTLRQKKGGDS